MDTFTDSSWYYLRFADPFTPGQAFDPVEAAKWMPVDQYIGGSSTRSCTCSTRAST